MQKIKLYFHIGVHKTGTTTIQHFLRANAAILKDKGIYIPVEHFADDGRPQELVFKILDQNPDYLRDLESIKQKCIENGCHSIVISNEDMINMWHIDVLQHLNSMFDLKMIIYLRRQDKYIESNYAFFATLYDTRYEYKKDIFDIPAMGNIATYYCDLLNLWSGVLDKKSIFVKSYDQVHKNKNLLGSFIEIVGLKLDATFSVSDNIKNVSPNKNIVEFMLKTDDGLNNRKTYNNIYNWLKTDSMIKTGPKPVFLSREERMKLMGDCHACNLKISREFFNGKSLFDNDYNIAVPPSISHETIQQLIRDIKTKFNIDIQMLRPSRSGMFSDIYYRVLSFIRLKSSG